MHGMGHNRLTIVCGSLTDFYTPMFSINQRFLLLGQLLGITLYAYDELAVNTVMPIIAEQLNGDRFYGAAFAFYMIGAMVMVVWAGARLDRDGPRIPFATACILFSLGLLLAAAATNMEIFVVARFLQGLGGGALYAVLFSLTAHGYDTDLRAKVIGLTSAAWILPAMIGPISAALVHEYIGWRWIFIIQLPLVAITYVSVIKALNSGVIDDITNPKQKSVIIPAISIGIIIAISSYLLTLESSITHLIGAFVCIAVAIYIAYQIAPPSIRNKNSSQRPLIVGRGLVHFSFYAADIFIPLALIRYYEVSPMVAGWIMVVGAIGWTIASSWVGFTKRPISRIAINQIGAGFVAFGLVLAIGILKFDLTHWAYIVAWALIGTGMGLSYNAIAAELMDNAPKAEVGKTSTLAAMSDSLGIIIASGVGGYILNATTLENALTYQWVLATFAAVMLGAVAGRSAKRLTKRGDG